MRRTPARNSLAGTGLALVIAALTPAAFGQAPSTYARPHTSWGAPDLQGFWTNASITKMSRPASLSTLVITEEQAKKLEAGDFNNQRLAADQKPTDQTLGAPQRGNLQANGNYNAFWWDPGTKVAQINGEYRSSWIVEPTTGRIPYKNVPARPVARPAAAAAQAPTATPAPAPAKPAATPKPVAKPAAKPAAKPEPTAKAFVEPGPSYGAARTRASPEQVAKSYEGPESRSLGERCLIGFGGTGGPVMTNVLYNNMYQIVQSPTAVMIQVEMNHDARIIPITHDRKRPDAIKPWLGDSIGWYEGDTLVVETRNVNPRQGGYIGEHGKLTERFTRIAADAILYQFEVDDPDRYTQVWKGEMPFRTGQGGLFEYACHEGNYGLVDILQGARQKELRGEPLELTGESE
jgi:hypothetical protein